MVERCEVAVKIVSQKGTCECEHKVGDEWLLGREGLSPEGLCLTALSTLFSFARVLRLGGTFPWESNPDVTTIACPDAQNPVVFELRRLRK